MSKGKVMIVEDEIIGAMMFEEILRSWGYDTCEIATSGEDAIAVASRDRPSVILMDVCIYGEIDGIEAARRIRAELDVPIIFITGYLDGKMRMRADSVNPAGYITKPFIVEDLEQLLARTLGHSATD